MTNHKTIENLKRFLLTFFHEDGKFKLKPVPVPIYTLPLFGTEYS
jgi:hypothetical protein